MVDEARNAARASHWGARYEQNHSPHIRELWSAGFDAGWEAATKAQAARVAEMEALLAGQLRYWDGPSSIDMPHWMERARAVLEAGETT